MRTRGLRPRLWLGASLGMLFFGLSSIATADETPVTRTMVGEQLRAYYESEKSTAYMFVAIGALSSAAGGVLVTRKDDFSRGLGWSILSLGAFEAIGAAFYAFQVQHEIVHYSEVLARDPAAYKREEQVHIHGTTTRFVGYRIGEAALALAGAGVATYGFIAGKDVWKGAGIGIAAEALTFFVLDGFGQARALDYEDHVKRFEPTIAMQVGGGERPWTLEVGARF